MSLVVGHIGELAVISRRGTDELSVDWRVGGDYLSLSASDEDWYLSPEFEIGDECWRLRLWPSVRTSTSLRCVAVGLVRWFHGPPTTIRFSLGIRGSGGAVQNMREGEKEFCDFGGHHSYGDFCLRSDLVEHRTRLMPDDTLVITCTLKRPDAARDASTQTDSNLEAGVKQTSEKRGGEKALEDLSKLLASGEESDVTVQVGEREFRVHRALLFARSPALSVSLRHQSRESESSRIVIEDCDPEVFGEYLHYLYTGSVRSLNEQNVFGLYRIADQYLADDLKLLCLEHVRKTLSVQTFCDAVKLALTHGESDLLRLAIDFAAENIQSILTSVQWQNFICEHPREANEILVKSVRP